EDASKQGRKIHDIDADEDITLENVYDAEMVDTGVLDDEEVFAEKDVAEKEVSTADLVTTDGEVVTTASVEVSTSSPTELTLAQTLIEIKSAKPKVKGVVIEEKSESTTRTRPQQLPSKDKAEEEEAKIEEDQEKKKREKRNKPLTKAQQRSIMTTYLKNMAGWKPKDLKNKSFTNVQELFEKAMKRVNIFVDMDTKLVEGSETRAEESSKRACDELEQENAKKQKIDDDQETTELQSMMEVKPDEEEVAVDVIPLATKPPSIMLKNFDREDLETLWKLVKAKHGSITPEEGYERVLWGDLKTMFRHHIEDTLSSKLIIGMKCVINFLSSSQNNSRINEVFGSILLVIMKLSMKKLKILKKNIMFRGGLLGLKDFMMILELLLLRVKLVLLMKIEENIRITTAEKIKTAGRVYADSDEIKDLSEKG
ncbi:hypothetical protein Tco_1178043, partial [Tanacetum coccineum]